MTELKLCPFCDGDAEHLVQRWGSPPRSYHGVKCSRCGIWQDSRSDDTAEAAAIWNTRAAIAQPIPETYGSGFLRHACPGDEQDSPPWILRFSDPDCREQVFIGEDAAQHAWEAWNRYAPSYNCWLFQCAAINAMPDTVSHDQSVFDLLEPLAGAISANGGPDIRGYFARATGGVDSTDLVKLIADRMGETVRIAELEEARFDVAVKAYIAGATDVHNNWQEDRDPDFTEAAHDYARTTLEDTKQGAGSND